MFSPDSGTLVAVGPGGPIRVWDVAHRRMRHRLPGTMVSAAHSVLGLNGTVLAVTGRDDQISIWDLVDGRPQSRIGTPGRAVACHPTKPLLAAVTSGYRIELWNLHGGERVRTLSGHTGAISRVGFSPDGATMLSTGQDGTLRIWDVATGRRRTVLEGIGASLRRIAVHAASGWVASALPDGRIRLFSLASGDRINELPTGGDVVELQSTRDGRALALLDAAGRVRLYDVPSGRARLRLPADPEPATRILVGPGRLFATVGGSGPIRVRDARDGEVRHVLRDGGDAPRYLRFAPDGRHLAVAGRDGSVRLYDLRAGRYLALREKPAASPVRPGPANGSEKPAASPVRPRPANGSEKPAASPVRPASALEKPAAPPVRPRPASGLEKPTAPPVRPRPASVLEKAGITDRSWLTRWGIGPIEP